MNGFCLRSPSHKINLIILVLLRIPDKNLCHVDFRLKGRVVAVNQIYLKREAICTIAALASTPQDLNQVR